MENRKIAFRKFAQTIFFKGNAQIVSLSNNSFELLQLLYEYTEHNPSRETGDGKVRVAGPITSLYCILGHDTLIFRCLFLPRNTNGKCWTVHVGGTCQGPVSPHPGEGGGMQQSRLPDATETGWVPPEEPLGSWSCSLNCRLVRLIYTPLCLNRLICGIRTSISQGSSFIWELQSNVSRARVCSMGWKETLTG